MMQACEYAAEGTTTGVAAALRAVDCIATEATATAFGRLFAPGGTLVSALTILLTLFVAFFAIQLLLGRSGLSVRSVTPRMMTLGLVLTFATSWVAYQSVVWNLAIGAPDQLAGILTGSEGSATAVFADKIDVVFLAIQEVSQGQQDFSAFSPQGMMWLGALLFLLGTVGVLVTSRIALAVLLALGPVFVVMALFNGTRGLFTGWLKGVAMLALAPLFVVLGGSIMLELAVPILQALTATPGVIDAQAAMAFFLIGAVHVALMVMCLKIAGTMVSGWSVFGLATGREDVPVRSSASPAAQPSIQVPTSASSVAASGQARAAQTAAAASSASYQAAANDSGPAHTTTRHVVFQSAGQSGNNGSATGGAGGARLRGIGNRFRPAPHPKTEKLK